MGRSRSRSRSREKRSKKGSGREKDRDRDKDRDKDRDSRHKDAERDRDRDKDRGRDRDRDRDKHHDSKRSRRSHSRDRGDDKDHRRSSKRDRDGRDNSQQQLETAGGAPQQLSVGADAQQQLLQQQQQQQVYPSPALMAEAAAMAAAAAALSQQEAAERRKEEEQATLDAEIDQRRKKVEEWRAKKQQEQGASAAAAADEAELLEATGAAPAAGQQDAGWSFEDDDDDNEPAAAAADGEGEVDPLDAYMQDTEATLSGRTSKGGGATPPPAAAAAAAGDAAPTSDAAVPSTSSPVPSAAAVSAAAAAPGAAPMKFKTAHARWGVRPAERRKFGDAPPPASAPMDLDANGAAAPDDGEIDPLDAFMNAEVLPQARAAAAAVAAAETAQQTGPSAALLDEGGTAGGTAGGSGGDAVMEEAGPSGQADVVAGRGPALEGGTAAAPAAAAKAAGGGKPKGGKKAARKRRQYGSDTSSDSSDDESSEDSDDAEWARTVTAGKASKGDRLFAVDHSKVVYRPFRKNFYIEVPELARMSKEEVAELRKELDGIKVAGANVPTPIRSFAQAGLSGKVLDILRKGGFEQPLPIQAQAIPVIMSGRDCIGVAKTGSGKTLAFVLPLLRHVKDQPPMEATEGPIALIMAPTRELVQQISKEIKKFAKVLNLVVVAVFGGSGVANQISELKRGCDVVVCTPGRMIDLLVTSNGKITNMKRVTYLVLDEADRMFDMGFEPQIGRITQNIRPSRQTVLFSATFPRQVEVLARRILTDPVEIQVGGRSVVNADITQIIEIRPEGERFLRLLEILGEWYENGKILVFVHSQEGCDNLFRELLKYGYPCLSLHGGKDQSDRECTLADFKGNVCSIMVATSVAARGLDVKELVLVVNYDVPNHHEDYVHRCGRTGRAGAKGTAITFIGPDEERYAPDLVKALRESHAPVPEDLAALANSFNEKRKQGLVQGHGSGYGGSGFKFDSNEAEATRAARKEKAKELGFGGDDEKEKDKHTGYDSDGPAGAIRPATQQGGVTALDAQAQVQAAIAAATAIVASSGMRPMGPPAAAPLAAPVVLGPPSTQSLITAAAQQFAARLSAQAGVPNAGGGMAAFQQPMMTFGSGAGTDVSSIAARAAAIAASFAPGGAAAAAAQAQAPKGFEAELEINDFPQHARWKVTHKDSMNLINDLTGAAVTTRGTFVAPGKAPPPGERKIYLLIEGPTELSVKRAKQEIKRILEETTEKVLRRDGAAPGRYSVM